MLDTDRGRSQKRGEIITCFYLKFYSIFDTNWDFKFFQYGDCGVLNLADNRSARFLFKKLIFPIMLMKNQKIESKISKIFKITFQSLASKLQLPIQLPKKTTSSFY